MSKNFQSSRDIIIRTPDWDRALEFYGKVLGLPVSHRSETMPGFETGAFCLYLEKGEPHGPVFEYLVPDVPAAKQRCWPRAAPSSRRIPRCRAVTCATPMA